MACDRWWCNCRNGRLAVMECVRACSELQMYDRVRGQDIRLLRFFNITYIFDLMLEMKKVKFGMKSVPLLLLVTYTIYISCSLVL